MRQDFKLAVRVLAKSPATTVAMIVALALGIGANSAIFSVLNAVVLRPLAYPDSARLVRVWQTRDTRPGLKGTFSIPDYLDLRTASTSFEHLAAYDESSVTRTDGPEPEHVEAGVVTPNFFPTLGVAPARGRGFLPEEERAQAGRVVLLSDAYWRRAFGGDDGAVGRQITLDGARWTVVGVMPTGLRSPMLSQDPDIWLPPRWTDDDLQRGAHFLSVLGRLHPGVAVDAAQADAAAIGGRLAELYPQTNAGNGFGLGSLYEDIVGDVRPVLYVMLGAVALVLLIACANVANLLLARSAGRAREVAVRAALGASRRRIVRQFLVESALVGVTGGLAGLAIAWWGVEALVAMSGDTLPRTTPIGIDLRVVAFTTVLSVACGVLFGMIPALQASAVDPHDALSEGGRGSTGGRGLARSIFVVAQVALSLVLLVASGLLLRSLYSITRVDPGFDPNGVLTAQVSLPSSTYADEKKQAAFADDLAQRVRALPGVRSAAILFPLPYSGSNMVLSYRPAGTAPPTRSAERTSAAWKPVGPDYFTTMRIPLVRGRAVEPTDVAETTPVLVVNQAFARRAFGDDEPIGKRLTIGYNDMTMEIVGVVGDVRSSDLRKEPVAEMYSAFAQTPLDNFNLVVRADGDPASLAGPVRDQIAAVDRAVPLYDVATMETRVSDSLEQQRFSTVLIGLFAAVALVISAVGIYAVLAYTVELRRREIGVRMALGAERRHVLRLVVGGGILLAVVGIAIGVAGALGATRALDSMLFGVSATDPLAFAATAGGLALVALLACYIPARRAARIDPATALRSE
jgi:predicted permease